MGSLWSTRCEHRGRGIGENRVERPLEDPADIVDDPGAVEESGAEMEANAPLGVEFRFFQINVDHPAVRGVLPPEGSPVSLDILNACILGTSHMREQVEGDRKDRLVARMSTETVVVGCLGILAPIAVPDLDVQGVK